MTKNKSEKINQKNWDTLRWRIVNDISDWRKKITETLKYSPNPEKIVQLNCKNWEEKAEILKNPEFLDENNFRLQIWKMQENWWTLYNDITLWLWIEYMINHTKKWEHSVIQIWSDVWENLQKWAEEWVLSALQEKEKLEKFIKKKFWKKWEVIKVEIWSEKYPEVFEAISKWKTWIIPNEEPNLENIVPFHSPLQIIQYLAYHANKDEKLMKLFHNTKPNKYLAEDVKLGKKPWESDADFYGIVEVWLRLYEVLNWVSIQWWLWRQRVYDKIISLIINWKDVIKWKEEFDCNYKLFPKDYPALERLHETCMSHYPNTQFNQLYIELSGWDKGGIKEIENKLDKKSKLKSKLRIWWYGALIAATLSWATWYTTNTIIKNKEEQKQEIYEQERIDMHNHYYDEIREWGWGLEGWRESEYIEEQSNILMAEYNISNLNQENEYWLINNDIIEMYKKAFNIRSQEIHKNRHAISKLNIEDLTEEDMEALFWPLDAEEFARAYWWQIINDYHLPYQKPYEHFNQYKDIIENTLKYWNIDISKYKTKEIPIESKLSYFIKDAQSRWFYLLKCFEVDVNWKKIKMFAAAKQKRYRMGSNIVCDYTSWYYTSWYQCMRDLAQNYPYVLN